MRSLVERTSISRLVTAAAASSTETSAACLILKVFHSADAIRAAASPICTTVLEASSITAAKVPSDRSTLSSIRPIIFTNYPIHGTEY